ncbi:hypothetical protein M0Q97_05175 [Candidatus Dojkabacteria bacterium]|jgi:hypothetical protein|nr:hypothetical protein [Candidatus Dojkabacteria bacterium]
MDYADYIAAQLDSNISYADYIAAQLDSNISYADYIAENIGYKDLAKEQRELREKKLKRILNEEI